MLFDLAFSYVCDGPTRLPINISVIRTACKPKALSAISNCYWIPVEAAASGI